MKLSTNKTTNLFTNLNEIKKSCEKLITETQCDIEIFRNEQENLQKQIQGILVENDLINCKLEVLRSTSQGKGCDSRDDATRQNLAQEAFINVKKQIDYLQAENNDIRSLNKTYQRTIENLENEIQNYRNQLFKPTSLCEVKHKYVTAIKLLECTIKHQNSELKEKSQTIESLLEQKNLLSDHIEKTEKLLEEKSGELEKFAEKAETISKLEEKLSDTERHNKELLKSLEISRQAIEKRFKREQSALQKVQEALNVAEAAVADKEEALKRERVVKEECDNIASTIGHVMDEAARKVESDMEAIKNKYIEKEKVANEQKNKLKQELQNQKQFNQILETRCKRFQQKCMDVKTHNNHLTDQLERMSNALWDLQEKFKNCEHQSNEETQQNNLIDQDNEIQHFVKSNRTLIERYTNTINDITKNFETEIYNLKEEIARLEAENKALKLKCNS